MNLYIHVPFCAQRCSYCDFYTQTRLGLRVRYLEALLREIRERRQALPRGEYIKHIYLGGGTPSLLSINELEVLFDALYQNYPIVEGGEITLEANPDDMTQEYALGLRTLPINRVSMGVQSFQDEDLRFLNRRHNREQVYRAVEHLRSVGIDNLSLDLIYGLPGQTEDSWQDNLHQIIDLAPPHISAYHLIYEEDTALTSMRDRGLVQEVSEEVSIRFLEMLTQCLSTAGYEHYEVSNFALPGRYAQLNTGYWQGECYWGFGPSAHSFDGIARSYNVASIEEYVEGWELGKRIYEIETLSPKDRHNEYIMTRLRTQWGIDLDDYLRCFGVMAYEKLLSLAQPYIEGGQLLLKARNLRLSSQGLFISDAIFVSLFW